MDSAGTEKKAIVVVEDNEPIADLIKDTLNSEPGYQAVVVNNGAEAIEVIRSVHASLILLDVGLPGLSGIEIYDILQADPLLREVPIIFLTAQSETRTFRDRQFEHVIAKPFTLDQLLEAVARYARPTIAANLDGTGVAPPAAHNGAAAEPESSRS
jgi:two-component system, OmpR family, alkaline phosphatase synthesis response regulator PhoP